MKWFGLITAMILAAGIGFHSLDTGFISDDYVLLEAANHTSFLELFTNNWLGESDQGGFYRPITILSFKLDHSLHGFEARGYHWTNLWLHVLTTLLLFLLVLRFQDDGLTASLAASLFAVHPVHTETIAWLSGRTDLLCAFFYLLCLNIFLAIDPRETRGCLTAIFAVFTAGLAMLSKEMGYTIPLMIIVLDRLDRPRDAWWRRSRSQHYFSYFALLTLILIARYFAVGSIIGGYGETHFQFGRIFSYLSIYLNFLIEPFSLNAPLNSFITVIFLLGVLLLTTAGFINEKTRPAISFMWIAIIPVLTLCRAQYLYIPSMGIFWSLGILIRNGKWDDRSLSSDIARWILSVTLIICSFAYSAAKADNWQHSGWVASAIKATITSLHPSVPDKTRIVLLNPPQNNRLGMGVFQNGFAEAVRQWYRNDSLDGLRVRHPDQFTGEKLAGDLVFNCRGNSVEEVTDTWLITNQTTYSNNLLDKEHLLNSNNRLLSLPMDQGQASGFRIISHLSHGAFVKQDTPVAELSVEFADGQVKIYQLKAGVHTSEWAIDRPDVKNSCLHNRAEVVETQITGEAPEPPILSHSYIGLWVFDEIVEPERLNIRFLLGKDTQSGLSPILTIRAVSTLGV